MSDEQKEIKPFEDDFVPEIAPLNSEENPSEDSEQAKILQEFLDYCNDQEREIVLTGRDIGFLIATLTISKQQAIYSLNGQRLIEAIQAIESVLEKLFPVYQDLESSFGGPVGL